MLSRTNICILTAAASVVVACAADTAAPLRIGDVQGDGASSPYVGQSVTVEGIVTGDFQDDDSDRDSDLGGFYIQDLSPDNDPDTSDGIFVYDSRADVAVGDVVRVTGEVAEFFSETQLAPTSVAVIGTGAIDPVPLEMPVAGSIRNRDGVRIADLESYEGMLVRIPGTLTVIDSHQLQRAGTLTLHVGGRATQFTNGSAPNARAYARHREQFVRRTLLLDDGRRDAEVTPVRYLFPFDGRGRAIRTGDTVSGLTGVIRYSRDSGGKGMETYRLMPVGKPKFEEANPQTQLPAAADGVIRVMSFNALNFFPTLDTGNAVCGPRALGCRGADSRAELERQRAKLITTLAMADADVIGLMEIENDARRSLRQLASGLVDATGESWAFIDSGVIGDDVIKVGILYNEATLRPIGSHAVLDASVDPDFIDTRNRPVLAQSFAGVADNERFTLAVNHLKSKGSDCDDLGDPDERDGQGNCNVTRTRAARAEIRWLEEQSAVSGTGNVLVIGDLNAYRLEDPVRAFTSAGYVNLLDRFVGEDAYSFVFRGESGALDHALATPGLAAQVRSAREWHINADEPRLLDYNLDNDRNPGYFDADTPNRASDHDPVIVDLFLD